MARHSLGQRRAAFHCRDEDRRLFRFGARLLSSRRPGAPSGGAIRFVVASFAHWVAPGHCRHARFAGRDLHYRWLGRRHLFWRGSPQSRPRRSARHLRQRLLHHGNLSSAESHRALYPADAGNRWKQFRSRRRRRPRLWNSWRLHHSLDHDHFHVELSERQSAFLFAHSLCHEL